MNKSGELYLYDTATASQSHQVEQRGLDVFFPHGISWSEVLDCRITPYTEKSLEENCEYASQVRKSFILVTEDQVASATLPQGDDVAEG